MPFKDPEKEKEYKRQYYLKNKEKIIKQSKEYNEINKDKKKEYDKKKYLENKGKILERNKEYRKKNQDKIAEYRQTEKYKKSTKIGAWKSQGLISDNYEEIYEKYINTNNCEECHCEIVSGGKNKSNTKCMDHDHTTGLFRNILCNSCNIKRG